MNRIKLAILLITILIPVFGKAQSQLSVAEFGVKQGKEDATPALMKALEGTVGNTIVFGAANRKYPGFVVSDCSDITFYGITIHHSGGMGIIGQRTHNITVDHCKVTPSTGRMLSCTADATHFVNCTGKIELSHCLFENQLDDATNIHGT